MSLEIYFVTHVSPSIKWGIVALTDWLMWHVKSLHHTQGTHWCPTRQSQVKRKGLWVCIHFLSSPAISLGLITTTTCSTQLEKNSKHSEELWPNTQNQMVISQPNITHCGCIWVLLGFFFSIVPKFSIISYPTSSHCWNGDQEYDLIIWFSKFTLPTACLYNEIYAIFIPFTRISRSITTTKRVKNLTFDTNKPALCKGHKKVSVKWINRRFRRLRMILPTSRILTREWTGSIHGIRLRTNVCLARFTLLFSFKRLEYVNQWIRFHIITSHRRLIKLKSLCQTLPSNLNPLSINPRTRFNYSTWTKLENIHWLQIKKIKNQATKLTIQMKTKQQFFLPCHISAD